MKYFTHRLTVVMLITGFGLLDAGLATAGINVNESGNAVLCKDKACNWLKPACSKEGGTYTQGAGGTGKCNFPSIGELQLIAAPKAGEQVTHQPLRNISPDRGRLVPSKRRLKVKGSGDTEAVCCTHWNTSSGGTGCATYPDSCPDDTFTVKCGKDGCW